MGRFVMVVQTNSADPEREAEFNEWYDKVHLPDVLEVPAFKKAARYVATKPAAGSGKFLAIYEIECDDIETAQKQLMEMVGRKRAEGRMSNLLQVAVAPVYYEQISSLSK